MAYLQVQVLMSILVITSGKRMSSVYKAGLDRGGVVIFNELHHPAVMKSIVSHPSLATYNHVAIMANRDPLYHNTTLMRIAKTHARATRSLDMKSLDDLEIGLELEIVLKLLPLLETESMESHAGLITEIEKDLVSMADERGRSMTTDLMPLVNKIENILTKMGVDGQACILRAVCEVASSPHIQPLGLSGEMLHVLFRYFISSEYIGKQQVAEITGDSRKAYINAGLKGRKGNICSLHYPTCPISIFNLATHPSC